MRLEAGGRSENPSVGRCQDMGLEKGQWEWRHPGGQRWDLSGDLVIRNGRGPGTEVRDMLSNS